MTATTTGKVISKGGGKNAKGNSGKGDKSKDQ